MDHQTDGLLIQRAIRQFTPDVFQHPVWVRFAAVEPGQIRLLHSAVQQLQAAGDPPGACSLLFVRAALQAGLPDYPSAMESITQALKLGRRHRLAREVMWSFWAASAVSAQMGKYKESAGYLQQLEQALAQNNEWVLADLVELVRQLLIESTQDGSPALLRCQAADPQQTGLLIGQMLSWGKPLPAGAPGAAGTATIKDRERSPALASAIPESAPAWKSVWTNLRRFISGGRRVPPTAIDQPWSNRPTAGNGAPGAYSYPPLQVPVTAPSPTELPSKAGAELPANADSGGQAESLLPTHSETAQHVVDGLVRANAVEAEQPQPRAGSLPSVIDRPAQPPMPEAAPAALLNAYLLGSFRVAVCTALGEQFIESWPNARCRAVFAYLLDHHDHPIPREVLIETFWPDAGLDSARNSLNVAIYTLRHTLKTALDFPVILSRDSAYQVNPGLQLWVDVEAFEQHAGEALRQESCRAIDEAIGEYRMAIGLYPGDFLADTPYEEWTTLKRERLRVQYLETLDHLSMIYFNQNSYDACTGLCQRILSQDACREDAHRRLMRCYARQGQVHLALRQYQACVDSLRSELEVEPSKATAQLYRQIRRQEAV